MTDAIRFRQAREAAGLSKLALARRLGISRQAIQNFERGSVPVPSARLAEVEAMGQQVSL